MASIDLKRLRKDYKLTQSKLAELSGYKQGLVSLVENGKVAVPEAFLDRVSAALDIPNINKYVKLDPDELLEKVNVAQFPEPAPTYAEDFKIVDRLLTIIERQNDKIEKLETRIEELENGGILAKILAQKK